MDTFSLQRTTPNVLVVDDDEVIRLLLRQFLEGEGYSVVEAVDGYQAMNCITQATFDLVILDIAMPGMDGPHVCEQICKAIDNPPPVLMITAFDGEESVDRSFRAGAIDYIRKPIRWTVLKNRIRYIIGSHRSKQELKTLTRNYEQILDAAPNGICGLDKEYKVSYINPAALGMLKYDHAEVIGQPYKTVFKLSKPGTDKFDLDCCPFFTNDHNPKAIHYDEMRLLRKDGSSFSIDFRGTPILTDDKLDGAVLVFQDITERQRAAELIRYMANHDSLTSLPNRNYFHKRLPQAIALAKRYERRMFLLFIDLDRFKPINDTYGHDVGDMVLVEVGNRLSSMLRSSDSMCRLGGDEFVILLESADSVSGAEFVARKAIDLVNKPITVKEHVCQVGASIGISICPDDSDEAKAMLRHADIAMYQAKEKGRNCWVWYKDIEK
jgi:diguanylate cyclase (GGDEF)-like protein/PAS domain S-box-containing protein